MEACRIGIHRKSPTAFDVGAPMKHKELCYEILDEAAVVVEVTAPQHFSKSVNQWAIVMDISGKVDISAPVPVDALLWLKEARKVIERYNDDSAPELRPFNQAVMGET